MAAKNQYFPNASTGTVSYASCYFSENRASLGAVDARQLMEVLFMAHNFIEKQNDPKALKQIMKNANAKGDTDAYNRAFRRYCEVEGASNDDPNDPLVREFWETLAAYELLLAEKHGRAQTAGYTRRKVREHGVRKCLADWANSTKPTPGFDLLVERGMINLTGEALVLKYAHEFDDETVKNAKKRLENLAKQAP